MTSQVFAMSVLAWRERLRGDPRMLAVQKAAQDWATAWSSASATAVADLYAPTATVTDELMAVRTQSRDEVTALTALPAQSGGLNRVTIDRLPDASGPAIFVATPPGLHHSDPMRSMALLVTAGEGDQGPGHLAVVLNLDEQGRITHEERYHRVDTLTRCIDAGPGAAATGPRWWDAVTIPPAVAKIPTGYLTLDGRDVAMFNSTPGLDGLVTWAADRFTEAGLSPPNVTEVSFYGEHLDVCKGVDGRIYGLATGTTLALCFVDKTACTDPATCTQWTAQAKATTLHELAHLWIWAGLDTRTIDADTTRRFTGRPGCPHGPTPTTSGGTGGWNSPRPPSPGHSPTIHSSTRTSPTGAPNSGACSPP